MTHIKDTNALIQDLYIPPHAKYVSAVIARVIMSHTTYCNLLTLTDCWLCYPLVVLCSFFFLALPVNLSRVEQACVEYIVDDSKEQKTLMNGQKQSTTLQERQSTKSRVLCKVVNCSCKISECSQVFL